MGSAAHVVLVGGPTGLTERAEARLRFLESIWSRFRADSDITRLNEASGRTIAIHPDTALLLLRAIDGWRITSGAFDPTVLRSMYAAGYGGSPSPAAPDYRGCDGIEVDVDSGTARFPAGLGIDPGGIGKGLAADLVAVEMMDEGATGVLVNVGGDLRACGTAPTPEGWTVGVEDPFDADAVIAIPRVATGGVATSTPIHRRWVGPSGDGTHVIDPSTRRPILTDVASVTVIAGEAWMAEVASKAAMLAGFDRATDRLDELGVAGLAVSTDGRMGLSPRLGVFL